MLNIDTLSEITAKKIVNENNLSHISKVLSDRKNKKIELTLDEAIDIIAYPLKAIYGEILKLIILFIFARLLSILIPTLIITTVFSLLRVFAGGVHMDTRIKCFTAMVVMFIGSGQVVKNISSLNYNPIYNLILIVITYIIGTIIIKLYAPQDTLNKPITDEYKRSKFKKLSFIFLTVILIICIPLINNSLISLSIITGLLLELHTITPHGVKMFTKINNLLGGEK